MTYTAPLPASSPLDVIDLSAFEDLLTAAGEVLGEAAPLALGEAAPLAIALGGVYVTNRLLQWKAWDHFWLNVGATLNNVWHTAAGFLFGGGAAVSLDTIGQMIQLSTHVSIRASRQLVGSLASKTMSAVHLTDHALRWLAAWSAGQVAGLQHSIAGAINYTTAEFTRAERYADARVASLGLGVEHLVAEAVAGMRAELIRDVIKPLHAEVVTIGAHVGTALGDVRGLADTVREHVLPELAKASLAGAAALALAEAVTTWVDDCGEPMCQVQGPKTDWGKLLRLLKPETLLLLLGAVAAEDPHAVEQAAQDFARTFGPMLSSWATSWLGLTQGDPGGIASQVGEGVGKLTL